MAQLSAPALRLLERVGILVLSARHPARRYLDHTPATGFEAILLRRFEDLRHLAFIQIGANDGRRADPVQVLTDAYGWDGLLFEPLPGNFTDLQRNRGGNPRLRLRCAAVDLTAGRRRIYDLSPESTRDLPDWTRGLASFSRQRLDEVVRELDLPDTAIVAQEIETISWTQVWQEFGPRRCDLLVLDTEGYDPVLLRGADLARHRPRVILFEHACNTLEERCALYRELIEIGYEIATDGGDTVAHLPAQADHPR